MIMPKHLIFLLFLLPGLSVQAQVQGTAEIPLQQRQTHPLQDKSLDSRQAKDWNLQPEEWTRYRELMQGPLGTYSPNLDPLTALGIEARTDAERRRYAELQVQAEGRRVGKMLAYQRAYDEAWKRLYPDLQRVALPGAGSKPSRKVVGSGHSGRLAVFVKAGCVPCDQRLQQLQASRSGFDVYVVGSRQDDAAIRTWAAQARIDPDKVRHRTITLNHDSGRWLSLGVSGDLPAVVREVNGQWQRQ